MKPRPDQDRGRWLEGIAFTASQAALAVLVFQKYALVALAGLATLFYLLATFQGVRRWQGWVKPPYILIFWAGVFVYEAWRLFTRQ